MHDWRLDSQSGGNNMPLAATLCAVGRPWGSGGIMHAGGGLSNHTYITLDKVCEKHVLVVGGRTYERGFTVDQNGMTLMLSTALPWAGRTFVLGFGRVVREKRPDDWTRIRPTAEHFPVPDGINAGYHPYETMTASDYVSDVFPLARNSVQQFYLRRPQDWPPRASVARGNNDWRPLPILNTWGRVDPYTAHGFTVRGAVRLKLPACELGPECAPLEDDNGPQALVTTAYNYNYSAAGLVYTCRNRYFTRMLPDANGNLYLLPRFYGYPVLKLPAPDYDQLVDLGAAMADPSESYVDPFVTKTAGGSAYTQGDYACFLRLFDGRFLGFPNPGRSNPPNYTHLTLFDIAGGTAERIEIPAVDGGNTLAGTSRWKQPVQAADGRVYALPSTFPGNQVLVFDPETKQVERDDFGISYPVANIMHLDGIPCADGKIYFMQSGGGAATDMNVCLILDPVTAPLARSHVLTDFGIPRTVAMNYMSAIATPDGCPMFLGPHPGRGDNFYCRLVYNFVRDDYTLYRVLSEGSSTFSSTYSLGSSATGLTNSTSVNCDTDALRHANVMRFLMPEFTRFDLDNNINSNRYRNAITGLYFELPPLAFPGAYCRQAFFGRCG